MNRRDFLEQSLLAAASLSARPVLAGTRAAAGSFSDVRVTIDGNNPLGRIAPDFLGLGYEISSVAKPGLLSGADAIYVQLVRTLGAQGVIRVGGNTADYAHFSSQGQAHSSPYGTVFNRERLQELGSFLQATRWKLIWCLNLGSGSEGEAIAEAKAVLAVAKDRLLAFEIGNEPDLFTHEKHRSPGYSYQDWLAEYRRYKSALRAQIPDIPLAGPDAAGNTDWVARFAADEGKDAVLLTHHYYREGQNPTSTIDKLLAPDPKLQLQLDTLREASRSSGLPYRICEVNSFSGGGRPGVSDTMASALWVLDYLFTLASNGCSGVNMETGLNQLDFVSSYSPIADDRNSLYSARPEYYGMLAFSHAAQGELIAATSDDASGTLKAYASKPTPDALLLTLINKAQTPREISVALQNQQPYRRATVLRLTAPALDAKSGISLGGSEVTPTGTWKPLKQEALQVSAQKLRIALPPATATVITLQSSSVPNP